MNLFPFEISSNKSSIAIDRSFLCSMGFHYNKLVLESVKIPQLKKRINKLVANKLGVNIGFDLCGLINNIMKKVIILSLFLIVFSCNEKSDSK